MNFEVRVSKIHGRGVFATKPIPKGSKVTGNTHYKGFPGFNFACTPNAYITRSSLEEWTEAWESEVLALRDIEVGEELTVKGNSQLPSYCNCSACART